MGHNHEVCPSKPVRVDEEFSRVEETVGLRNRLNWNHNENQEFLNTLVHCLVFSVAKVEADDLCTCEQLHDNGTRNNWANSQVHDGTGCPCHDGTESTEQVKCLSGETVQHDVGHCEVDDENEGCRPHLFVEPNVSLWFGDGWVHVHEPS